ncbi:NfeD family protein [Colwellia sp. 12G3]|uniref:NfeD family protein n=1 Tax=Colwellia sp. 12G3 TaxID=2058299 RepID=UPI000C33DAF8|nr:nodulation protein NfeD [Colwellia sp. 12G3]PKI18205.1 serine protease [Colwellia sp. 12G3]
MRRKIFFLITIILLIQQYGNAQSSPGLITSKWTVPVLSINGAIGPAVSEYIVTEINKANHDSSIPLVIIKLDTPGGLSSSLRDINQKILNSTVPIACLVYPQGARAASAGTYMLYACHYAAMAPATTLGAATPVSIAPPASNQETNKKSESPSAMEKKVLNDAIAYIRSLAQLRDRNEQWAELAVSEAATLTAEEALANNVINFIVPTAKALFSTIIKQKYSEQSFADVTLENTQLKPISPNWRNDFIATITDPNIAYILMIIGIYGLVLEFYSPGFGVAGITGVISLFVALYAFQLLPLNYSGFALLLVGISLLIIESIMPSFGVFGIGGTIAFVLGSVFLIDTEQPQYQISLPLIAGFSFVSILFFVLSLGLMWRKRKNKIVSGQEELIGAIAFAEASFEHQGFVMINGERWAAEFTQPVKQNQAVKIKAINGLTLITTPNKEEEKNHGSCV